jgi:hypothetical protein
MGLYLVVGLVFLALVGKILARGPALELVEGAHG